MATSGGVKIPPDWLREPHFPTRSDLLEARRLDAHQLGLALASSSSPSPSDQRQFARSETIFRDSFRKSGAFDFSGQPKHDASQFHPRATKSGLVTRSAVLDARHDKQHREALKFEPQEIERLSDIPRADKLRLWWQQPRDGYVADPSTFCATSLRLELARRHHGLELGPMDPGKVRYPASVDERRRLKDKKAELADKVQRISHASPEAYLKTERAETATIVRAPDLYAQERRTEGGGGGGLTRSSSGLPAAFPLVSPIKVPTSVRRSRQQQLNKRLGIENLFLESTSQRVLLDQIKTCPPPLSGHVGFHNSSSGGFGSRAFGLTDQQQQANDQQHSPNQSPDKRALQDSVRCGGFSR